MGGAGHTHRLYRHGDTVLHRLPPQCKLVGAITFVLVVVATPREQFWAFGAYLILLAGVAATARIPLGFVVPRMVVELPFVLFAVLLPFVARGERIDVLGLRLSEDGLLSAWNILAKGTLGVITSILLAATTEPRDVLLGMERLRLPPLLVQIATFMLRYIHVIVDEMRRMRVARESRAFEARDIRHLPVVARSLAALFLRSYERGERVYLAMLSRGYAGAMPVIHDARASAGQWVLATVLPATGLVVALSAWMVR